jgi:enoyl-CoA hydratase/carnithine racemase
LLIVGRWPVDVPRRALVPGTGARWGALMCSVTEFDTFGSWVLCHVGTMTNELLYDVSGHVGVITFNRPDRMNTITGSMLAALSELLLEADADDQVRVIVLTGNGRAWCAGLDVGAAASGEGIGGDGASGATGEFNLRDAPPVVLNKIDTPTIAALNGGAAGYGMDLALGCDIRIAADTAKLSAAYTARGLVPESGGTWLLPRIVGWSKAAELLFTARTLSAADALELGLVSEVVPADELRDAARALAEEIAANAPLAVRASKRLMRHAMTEDLEDHVQRQYLALLALFGTEDFREGLASFLEKRPADFKGQ